MMKNETNKKLIIIFEIREKSKKKSFNSDGLWMYKILKKKQYEFFWKFLFYSYISFLIPEKRLVMYWMNEWMNGPMLMIMMMMIRSKFKQDNIH